LNLVFLVEQYAKSSGISLEHNKILAIQILAFLINNGGKAITINQFEKTTSRRKAYSKSKIIRTNGEIHHLIKNY